MDDLISRQAAIDAMWEGMPGLTFNEALKRLRELPTAEKKGKWIDERGVGYCSVCGKTPDIWCSFDESEWKYCPLCGARMEET